MPCMSESFPASGLPDLISLHHDEGDSDLTPGIQLSRDRLPALCTVSYAHRSLSTLRAHGLQGATLSHEWLQIGLAGEDVVQWRAAYWLE